MGFGGGAVPGLLLGIVFAGIAVARRSVILLSIASIHAAGIAVAHTSDARSRDCRTTLGARREWVVELEDPAAPGAYIRGRSADGGCGISVTLSVESGTAAAGARVRVSGDATMGERVLLVRRARVATAGAGPFLTRWRASARSGVDRTFGGDAALARALLVADTRGISTQVRDRYAAAGVVHLLSISGLHVAIIASAAQLLFASLRFSPRAAGTSALLMTALYIAIIGAPAPAVRSGIMLGVTAVSRLGQRPTSPWAALALGALGPLAEPRTVLDLGYQLSVAGMAAIIASGALVRRVVTPRLAGWRRWLAASLLSSIVAGLVTSPLVAWTFGQVSVVAPLTNLVATPVLTLVQPMLFLALLLAPVPVAARFVADASHPLLALFDAIARIGSQVPGGSLAVAPTLVSACIAGGIAVAFVVGCVSLFPVRALIAGVAGTAMLAWAPLLERGGGDLELHIIDVGQGDGLAIRTPQNRWVVVDAGRAWSGGDAGRSSMIPHIRRLGGTVEAFVLSHPHEDHVGGAATILRALRPRLYWDAAYVFPSQAYRASLAAARESGIEWRRVRPGDSLAIDGVVLRVLAPDSAWTMSLDDPNEASTMVLVQYGNVRMLLTGDAESAEEAWVVSSGAALRADVLKVAHHGSPTSTTPAFLRAVQPRLAVISVGAGNRYGHPGQRVLRDLAAAGAWTVRTDQLGTIVVRTDGRSITVEAEGDAWELLAPSSGS